MDTETENLAWTDTELEASVNAYLKMLEKEKNGQPFIKSQENQLLREGALSRRSSRSVDYRMQNISALMEKLGLPLVKGYAPAKNIGSNVENKLRKIIESKIPIREVKSRPHSQERCAWVFQYIAGSQFEKRWLSKHEISQSVPWEISSLRDVLRAGDLVFFWQISDQGGLRGWGEIDTGELLSIGESESESDYRIAVKEKCWIEPIQPENLPAASPLKKTKELFFTGVKNFPLTPKEAIILANLLPESEKPSTDGLITKNLRLKIEYDLQNKKKSNSSTIRNIINEDALEVLFHSDDPWAQGLEDKIGVLDEAKAMAALALRTEDPPLAIGILGNWGSGKTFFMRLIHQQIEQNSTNTVLIRFNAWHFVETNLWASLVDHIFTELDQWVRKNEIGHKAQRSSEQLFENLSTTKELALEAIENLVNCRQAQDVANKRLAASNDRAKVFWRSVLTTLKNKDNWQEMESAASSLGLEKIWDDTQKLKETIDGLSQQKKRAIALKNGLLNRIGSWPTLLLGASTILVVPLVVLKAHESISAIFSMQINTMAEGLIAFSAPIATIAGGMAWLLKRTRSAIDKLAGFRATLDDAIEQQSVAQSLTVSKLEAEAEEARNLVSIAAERVAEAVREFEAGSGRGRMLQFIRERANDGHYASHLGLVATIRKDFEELSRGLSSKPNLTQTPSNSDLHTRIKDLLEANDNFLTSEDCEKLSSILGSTSTYEQQQFKRIVLFIDDLDRCPPTKVIEVLQAVHLLLGFPLFIVFVAADVRWINRSLATNYPDLLDSPSDNSLCKARGATAHDYLEKIFQIPYWVRPMNADASISLLESQIKKSDKKPSINEVGLLPLNVSKTPESVQEDFIVHAENVTTQTINDDEANEFNHRASRLSFSEAERDFLRELAPFAGNSPRRIVRFINTYRIIKISLPDDENLALETRYFRELLLQLAISTAAPEIFEDWLNFLQKNIYNSDMESLLENITLEPWYHQPSAKIILQGVISVYRNTNEFGKTQDILESSKLVKRYSFTG